MAIITTDIVTEYGAYYLKSGQNQSRLFKKLRFESATDRAGMSMQTDETVWQASEALITELLQPWQKQFTPKGDLEFKPAPIYLHKMKADMEICPDDIEGTWLSFLDSDEAKDRKNWPIVRWMLEEHFVPKLMEDWETQAVYAGVKAAPTPGTPGAATETIDGLKKIINDHITAGDITTITTGAPDANNENWVGQVEDFVDAVDDRYTGATMQLNMSPALYKKYRKGMRSKYGKDTDFSGMPANSLPVQDVPNITVVSRDSMIGSDKIWMTPRENLRVLQKRTMSINNIMVESEKRVVNIMMDFWKGIGFIIPGIVFTNDQDL